MQKDRYEQGEDVPELYIEDVDESDERGARIKLSAFSPSDEQAPGTGLAKLGLGDQAGRGVLGRGVQAGRAPVHSLPLR